MSRDLPKAFLLIRGQIRFDVLRITAEQVNTGRVRNVKVDNPRAATLPLSLRCPSQFPHSAPCITSPASEWSIRYTAKIVNAIGSD
jgi:hypothetical protein